MADRMGATEYDLDVVEAEYELTGLTSLNGIADSYKRLDVNIDEEVIPVSCYVTLSSMEKPSS